MQRVVIHRAGGYEELRLETHPDRRPAAGEVRVRIEASGVNYADCVVRMGLYDSARELRGWPITPGFEFAGRVDEVGPAAPGPAAAPAGRTALAPGDAVFGVSFFDAYATHVVVPRHQLYPLPAGLGMAQAATFPAVFLTAWFALFELAHPRPGAAVLVHSAAGGVGSALLQLARIAGCRVVAVVGATHKVEAARALGAEVVIDKSREDLWRAAERAAPHGFDVVLDANGVSTLGESYRHLASPGKLVVYGFHSMLPRRGGRPDWVKLAVDWLRTPRFSPLALTKENRSVLGFNLSYLFGRPDILERSMADLLGWLGEGRIAPLEVTPYPLARVADAHRAIESGQTVGKLVLIP
jgi:NADPH:quinone reductase-like Zn-dependent oxidoreductase